MFRLIGHGNNSSNSPKKKLSMKKACKVYIYLTLIQTNISQILSILFLAGQDVEWKFE